MTEHLLKVPSPVLDRATGAVSTETAGGAGIVVDPSDPNADLERGFRYVYVRQPDGTEKLMYQLLTPTDILNPQEGDKMPKRPFHAQAEWDLAAMLVPLLKARRPDLTVFNDLIMKWGIPGLSEPSPDFSVVPDVRDPEADRGEFDVPTEGTRPILVIEIVSPNYRRQDREDKVEIYERAGVQEYVILDRIRRRGKFVDEVRGYKLVGGRYREMRPDEDGRLYCDTVGLFIALEQGRVLLWNARTGERLRTAEQAHLAAAEAEARAEAEAARAEAEAARARAEAQARAEAEARLAELQAELARLRGE